MPIIIGPGITVGSGITIGGTPDVVTSGLTLYLDGNNYTSGSTWLDQSGISNNATLTGSPTFSTNNGGYFSFNGTTQFATVSGSPVGTIAYTKSVWFQISTTSTDNNLISSNIGGHFMFFGAGRSNLYCGHTAWTNAINAFPSTTTFSVNTWYNATLTFNTTSGMILYINGVQDGTYSAQLAGPSGGQTYLAAFQDVGGTPGNALSGRISQTLLYNRVLTPSEVLQNFEATRSRFGI